MLTIGHSALPIETFLAILRENGVRTLADIRTIPKSRHNPQFAQENLARSLEEAGITYNWHKSLGGLRHPARTRSTPAGAIPAFADTPTTCKLRNSQPR